MNQNKRYWKIERDNKIFSQKTQKFACTKSKNQKLSLVMEDKDIEIILPENTESWYTNTASAIGNDILLESRNLNFKVGNNTVTIRVNENDNCIKVEI